MLRDLRFRGNKGMLCVSFGAGLLVASCFPYTVAVIIVAALLVCMGVSLCRC